MGLTYSGLSGLRQTCLLRTKALKQLLTRPARRPRICWHSVRSKSKFLAWERMPARCVVPLSKRERKTSMKQTAESIATLFPLESAARDVSDPAIPEYLEKTYWWAYLHPRAVRIFEREWLVNLILWGNFKRLRDLAIAELGQPIERQVLQVACVYGDFTQRIAAKLGQRGTTGVRRPPRRVAGLRAGN